MSGKALIVAANFNQDIVEPMIAVAETAFAEAKCAWSTSIHRVRGSYELPFLANLHLDDGGFHAFVALGYIERGETGHGEVMGHVVHQKLVELSLIHEVPLGIGIIGPGATLDQAQVRNEAYARSAVEAALAVCQHAELKKRNDIDGACFDKVD